MFGFCRHFFQSYAHVQANSVENYKKLYIALVYHWGSILQYSLCSGTFIDFEIGKTYHIAIKQLKIDNKYWYKIIINDEVKEERKINDPQSFTKFRFYTSASFRESFTNQFGKVCNFKILQDGGKILTSSLAY